MNIEAAHAALDKHLRAEEGERLKPYLCTAGVPTIGVGATTYLDGRKVTLADPPITKAQMDRMLEVEIGRYCAEVAEMVDGVATTNQLVALVLCAYNIGLDGLRRSSMIRAHRAGDYAAAARAFGLWNKARKGRNGPLEPHPVLTARRAREAAIYLTPDADDETHAGAAPQAVAPESSLAKSPINAGGAVTAASGAAAIWAQYADQVNGAAAQVKQLAETLGFSVPIVFGVVLVAVGVAVMVQRHKQRAGGWA